MNYNNLPGNNKRVLVAMSGGVDSSVAASLLVDQGYEVIGATMQVWDYSKNCQIEEGMGTCCSSLDVDDARAVCEILQIPFYVLNCESHFKRQVIDPFIESYLEGKTPVPCTECNTHLKFHHLIKKMNELDCRYLATGHYAQVLRKREWQIVSSADDIKDQTYFLFTLNPKILPQLLFPVGGMTKSEVRKYALDKGLPVAKKKDSTGICFVGNKGYGSFVEEHVSSEVLAKRKGWIYRYPTGEKMSPHNGIHWFTYGQSRGLGMDFHEKLFVIKIDPSDNSVWVGEEKYLYSQSFHIKDLHLLSPIQSEEVITVKIRYAHRGSPARFVAENNKIEFLEPQRAITPGQAAVFYRGTQLLGGGWVI